jgi:hypothetical protein
MSYHARSQVLRETNRDTIRKPFLLILRHAKKTIVEKTVSKQTGRKLSAGQERLTGLSTADINGAFSLQPEHYCMLVARGDLLKLMYSCGGARPASHSGRERESAIQDGSVIQERKRKKANKEGCVEKVESKASRKK